MNTLYITDYSKMLLDGDSNPIPKLSAREAIRNICLLTEDTKIKYSVNNKTGEIDAAAGDIVITFYDSCFPNPVIVVHSEKWTENIQEFERIQDANNKCECEHMQGDAPCESLG